jgi:hypothetical protein
MVLRTGAVGEGGEVHPDAPANFVPVQTDTTKFSGPGALVAKGCGSADRNNPSIHEGEDEVAGWNLSHELIERVLGAPLALLSGTTGNRRLSLAGMSGFG